MIRATDRLESFERQYAIETARGRTFAQALAVFEALWLEAASIDESFPGGWRNDVEADVELARVLNGLSERP